MSPHEPIEVDPVSAEPRDERSEPAQQAVDVDEKQAFGIARSDKKRAENQIRVDDVCYEVTVTNPATKETCKKTILQASLTIAPKSVTAIMGSTGAGKTTLLNLLANRIHPTSGRILVNGRDYNTIPMKRRLGYVMQQDKLMNTATVKESLDFAATLQLPNLTAQEREERVEMIMQELGLLHIKDSLVGGGMGAGQRGISGGERKRVAIGLVLIPDPDILLLDEPTTGLDSFTSEAVIETLNSLAAAGRTVICTIHQPSSEAFKKFDNLLLLSAGRVVYNGHAAKSMEYMAKQGFQCDQYTNPPDYYMQVLRTGGTHLKLREVKNEGIDTSAHLADTWEAGDRCTWGEVAAVAEASEVTDEEKKEYKGYASSFAVQFLALAQRSRRNIVRNPMLSRARIVQSVFLGLVIGAIFWKPGDDREGVQATQGGLFFIGVNQAMLPMIGTLHTFPSELGLVLREQQASMYSISAYFGAKSVIELPFLVFYPLLFVVIVYWMMGLENSAEDFFGCALIVVLTSIVAQSYGLLISGASPSLDVAQLLGPLVFLPFMLVAGFLSTDIPGWLVWLKKVAFVRWTFAGLTINEYKGRALNNDCAHTGAVGCTATGDQVLDDLNLDTDEYWVCVVVLIANFVALRALTLLVLKYKAKHAGGVQE